MKTRLIIASLAILLSLTGLAAMAPKALALNGSEWQAGRIIDDGVFNNGYDMTAEQIQSFLSNKVPTCDTWGTQPSEFGGGTRAQYGTAHGNPPPYVCLKDYFENPVTHENNLQGRPVPAGGISAANLIYYTAHDFSINPKVLLTTLQKESVGPLVTDTWPYYTQYKVPMGYACPDTAPCDSQYYGFYNQVSNAAKQFRRYADNPTNYRHKANQTNAVRFNPSTACGSSNVFIQSQATASLYNYTPYQPNGSALTNLYGTGDGCSAYGNRNFWRIYNDWFGSTRQFNGNIVLQQPLTSNSSGSVQVGDTITASYQVRNIASFDTYAGGLGICARLNGQNYDFGYVDQNLIPASGTITVSHSKIMDRAGELQLSICSYHASIGGWAGAFYPYTNGTPLVRTIGGTVYDNPLVTTGITFSPSNPAIGQPVTASMTIRNASSSAFDAGMVVMAARGPDGANLDFPSDTNLTIPANTTVTYSKTRTFTTPGPHNFFLANFKGGAWSTGYPRGSSGTQLAGTLQVKDTPLITTGIGLSPANPGAGQTVTATFTVTNESASPRNIGTVVVAARAPNGANVDFPAEADVIVPASGTYTYSKSRVLSLPGDYNLFIANFRGTTWTTTYPKSASAGIVRQTTVRVAENPLVTSGITLSPSSPTTGQSVTATVTIRNTSAVDVNIGMLVIAARGPGGTNLDFPADTSLNIPANSTVTYSKTRVLGGAGTYSLFLANFRNSAWNTDYPKSLNSSVQRTKTVTIP